MGGLAWSVVKPQAGYNLVPNPSFEVDLTGWTAINTAVLSRDTSRQAAGIASVLVGGSGAPGNGIATGFGTSGLPVASATLYTLSAYWSGAALVSRVTVVWYNAGGALIDYQTYSLTDPEGIARTGTWQRLACSFTSSVGATFVQLQIYNQTSGVFYLDGIVLEPGALSTYLDGDQPGCIWMGVPHGSTSYRSDVGPGGVYVPLSQYATVTTSGGIGIPPMLNVTQELGQANGAIYQRTLIRPRTLTLNLTVAGTSLHDLHAKQAALASLFSADHSYPQQPVTLVYDDMYGPKRTINVLPESSLDWSGLKGLTIYGSLRLLAPDGVFSSEIKGALLLDGQDTLAAAQLVQRQDGLWSTIGVGTLNRVYGLTFDQAYKVLYITDFIGSPWAARIYSYVNGVLTKIAELGGSDYCDELRADPSGVLYAAGSISQVNGIALAGVVKRSVTGVWSQVGTMAYNVQSFAFNPRDGMPYIGTSNGVYKWNGAAWVSVGALLPVAAGRSVYSMEFDTSGNLFVGGLFASLGGVTLNNVGYLPYGSSTWKALGTGTNDYVYSVSILPDQTIVFGGLFTTVNGLSIPYLARYNRVNFYSMGTVNAGVTDTSYDPVANKLIIVGLFTLVGTLTVTGSVAWNGAAFELVGAGTESSGDSQVEAYGNSVYQTGTVVGSQLVSGQVTKTPSSTVEVYPTLVLKGPGQVYSLTNFTTGQVINFNLNLLDGEVATLVMAKRQFKFGSNFRSNLMSTIRGGSLVTLWRLLPRSNVIGFQADSTVVGYLTWPESFLTVDGGV